jgi:uncharacterized DUF497 family protein
MRVVWDEPKRQRTLAERAVDFAWLTPGFFETAMIEPARDGRLKATSELNGVAFAVIFKPLGVEALSVISMRPASRRERSRYEKWQNVKSQRGTD